MKINPFSLVAAAAFFATSLNAAPSTKSIASQPKEESNVNHAAPVLEAGMTAKEVERSIGKPAEIKMIETSEGKAETWIYRRQIGKQTAQETVPTTMSFYTPGGIPEAVSGTVGPAEYRTKVTTSYQVTSLLMFEGKLVKAKQALSQVVSYDR